MRDGIGRGLAGLETAAALAASAVRHAGWWLEWHTRTAPHAGCRAIPGIEVPPSALS